MSFGDMLKENTRLHKQLTQKDEQIKILLDAVKEFYEYDETGKDFYYGGIGRLAKQTLDKYNELKGEE